ncbi:hypothetical protein V9T40_011936 [Parthenolecanium corni]|uniref:UDP-N-acetylglucosamine transferase subunit ALG14 n=1 Tax=Parthenolecanium corni TaxID=536013 RepID=A0AAN9T8N8_9HEMI
MFDQLFFTVLYTLLLLLPLYIIASLFAVKRKRHALASAQVKTMIVIGSGGHTSEMLRTVKHLNSQRFTPRFYIMADSDTSSLCKIVETETALKGSHRIWRIPRSRKVHQSYISSVFTTLYSFLYSIPIVIWNRPDVILCNGPGTCVPICVIGFLTKIFLFCNVRIIFIESICRVKSLSLTGKILIWFADLVIVQWPELKRLYKNTVYIDEVKL